MTDVKRLLEQATPLPWAVGKSVFHDGHNLYQPESQGDITSPDAHIGKADADLIVYAVNHLSDYEAAVDALERLLLADQAAERLAKEDLKAALRRLQVGRTKANGRR